MPNVKPTPDIVAICLENRFANATKKSVSVVIASPIEPGLVVEVDRVDDERVSLPVAA